MSALELVVARPALFAFARALVHFLWQGALIALGLRVVLDLARSPRVRYAAASLALAAMAAAPIATSVVLFEADAVAGSAHLRTPPMGFATALLAAVPLVWSLGALVMLVRLARGAYAVRGLRRRAAPLAHDWQERVERIARALHVGRRVVIAACEHVGAPLVIGVVRPMILVPPGILATMDARSLEAIVAHELAHVARFDVLAGYVAAVVEALLFFHPAVIWVCRTLRVERENAADDLAAAFVGDRLTYARTLAELEARRTGPTLLGAASNGGLMVDRIRRLALPPVHGRRVTPALVAFVALALCIAVGVACSAPERASAVGIPWLPTSVARYAPEITDAAKHHGVDPELIAIVTLMESKGDPLAVSPGGALGLMQLMPTTARAIALERGLPAPSSDQLVDPAYNLDLGAYYLARQLERFGAVDLAAAAYNGGPDCVDAFLAARSPLPAETSRYRERASRLWAARHDSDRPR